MADETVQQIAGKKETVQPNDNHLEMNEEQSGIQIEALKPANEQQLAGAEVKPDTAGLLVDGTSVGE